MYLFLDTNFSVAVVMYKDNISTSFSINSFPLKICILCLIHYSLRGRRFGKKESFPRVPCPPPAFATHLLQTNGTSLEQSIEISVLIGAVADTGEGPGPPPLIFRPNCGPKGRKKNFETAPLLALYLPYLKVWIRHCGGGVYITSVFYYTLEQGLFPPAILLK